MVTKRLDTDWTPTQTQVNDAATREYVDGLTRLGPLEHRTAIGDAEPYDTRDPMFRNIKFETEESYHSRMAAELALDAKARRDRIAEMALQGLLAGGAHKDYGEAHIIAAAISYAENLIAELDRA